MSRFLCAVFVLALAAGCGERPPRADPESVPSYNAEKGPNSLAERTREQGEWSRMDH
jgi:hypothetical protein